MQDDTSNFQLTDLLRWKNIATLLVLYQVCKVVYRLYLDPLSHIPGRKIAGMYKLKSCDIRPDVVLSAASSIYAFYHDVIRGGHYIWELEKMHAQFGTLAFPFLYTNKNLLNHPHIGPIIRISPTEIHINDPSFIDKLFTGPLGTRREKGILTINGLGISPTAIGTQDHTLHRSRRAALNPFFSTAKIRRLEPMVHSVLSQIFTRLNEAGREDKPVELGLLFRAATHDLISEYAFGEGNVCFGRGDLNQPYFKAYHDMVVGWHFGTYFPGFGKAVRLVPARWVKKVVPAAVQFIELIEVCGFGVQIF
jgi:hypothetical protein